MRPNMKWIAVVLVVVIIVLAYFALVGVKAKTPDVNDKDDDPTGGDRVPTAHGIIEVSIRVNNGMSRYYSDDPKTFAVDVHDFISWDEGQLYQNQKIDVLGIWSDDIKVWVKVQVRGPGQFLEEWQSEKKELNIDEWGWETVDFVSGRMFLWDTGSYTATLSAYVDGPEYSGEMIDASASINFEVSI